MKLFYLIKQFSNVQGFDGTTLYKVNTERKICQILRHIFGWGFIVVQNGILTLVELIWLISTKCTTILTSNRIFDTLAHHDTVCFYTRPQYVWQLWSGQLYRLETGANYGFCSELDSSSYAADVNPAKVAMMVACAPMQKSVARLGFFSYVIYDQIWLTNGHVSVPLHVYLVHFCSPRVATVFR